MSIEDELKQHILQKYKSIRAFTQEINMPYSTLDTMFKRGIQGASVSNVIKICRVLEIDIDALDDGIIKEKQYFPKNNNTIQPTLSTEHQEVLSAYDNAELHDKNLARMALRLPTLKEDTEFGEDTNFKTS